MPNRQCSCADYDTSCLLCGGTGNEDNTDTTKLTYDELQAEYERSQWALAWALKKLGGAMFISNDDIAKDVGKQYRTYYQQLASGTFIKIEEYHE